jgi:hypothetical protein
MKTRHKQGVDGGDLAHSGKQGFVPYSGAWSSIWNWGIMRFKPSAGIFVAGLVTMVVSGVFAAGAMSSSDGAGFGLLGFAGGIAGLIMLCVGAARALAIIDAIPAAFRSVSAGQVPLQQAPAQQQPIQQFPQQQPYSQPQPPLYNPSPRYEQQPPAQ